MRAISLRGKQLNYNEKRLFAGILGDEKPTAEQGGLGADPKKPVWPLFDLRLSAQIHGTRFNAEFGSRPAAVNGRTGAQIALFLVLIPALVKGM
jgi:hypothetical protein